MNWCSKFQLSNPRALVNDDRTDRCPHVDDGSAPGYMVLAEDDSFGPVDRTVVCKACYDEVIEHEQSEEHFCEDCRKRKPLSEGHFWRWYDFYAPQGDEPLFICHACWNLPTHQQRRRKDAAEARAEDEYNSRFDEERDWDTDRDR